MRDVAALAGVSVKTVSRVVNLEPHTRPEVVRRVRAAIAELDWVPNGSARTLRTGRTGLVAVAVTELRRPHLAMLGEALVDEIGRRGLQAAVEPTHGDPARLRDLLDARGRIFDGLVLIGDPGEDLLTGLRAQHPVVLVHGGGRGTVDAVDADLVEAASLVARHLVVMGRSRPVLLGLDRGAGGVEAMRAALASAGVTEPAPAIGGVRTRADGADVVDRARRERPDLDTLVCGSDEVALGALAALARDGVAVPDDVAVIGFDDLDDGQFTTPSLTTVDPGPGRLARAAIDLLADRLSGTAPAEPRRVISPVELIRRESTLGGMS
ncbi:transcriptional regulator, LacI family [Beutenbergia cavernae DSM 12333]|uniref:Transcriptional regulator, LacI family n=2 Tax=Beutenbergia TaxID=84756 RepID=C5BUU7_BEUC1|nr:transcriptional regulator, LacI family [Beutenbergia cavernae DSM 12333]